MSMFTAKTPAVSSFSTQVRTRQQQAKAAATNKGGTSFVEGFFDRLVLDSNPLWVRIHPQQYTYNVYNKESKQIEQTTTLFYEFIQHYMAANRRMWVCSSGPGRDLPCYGCAIRNKFYDTQRATEESTGVKERGVFPPVSSSSRFSLSLTVLEDFFALPLLNDDGTVRKTKKGDPIINWTPGPQLDLKTRKAVAANKEIQKSLGRNLHWSIGPEHLSVLADIEEELRCMDVRTGTPLVLTRATCAACGGEPFDGYYGVTGADLAVARQEFPVCPACGEEGTIVPEYENDGVEGSLLTFDLQLKVIKPSDTSSVLQLSGFRCQKDFSGNEALMALLAKPLDIMKIQAPTSVDSQAKLLGPIANTYNPTQVRYTRAYTSETAELPFGG